MFDFMVLGGCLVIKAGVVDSYGVWVFVYGCGVAVARWRSVTWAFLSY